MEFIKANYLNTTTQITVSSNTATAGNLFTRDKYVQYYTDGFNNDLTTASITISFSETLTVSRIALQDTNLKAYTVFYNGATANTFALTTTASTVSSSWSNNTDNNVYMSCTPVGVTSITIDLKTTQTANQEKLIGLLTISDLYYSMVQIPSSNDYTPTVTPKQIVHQLSDGGKRIHNIRNKWAASIGLDYITSTERDALKAVWELQGEFNFCPFGTTTGWDGILFEAIWEGPFEFYKYSDNAAVSGFSGKIKLSETPT
jgi:hypothetical protein